ncbi:hypothetical protein CAPTEDRAFT_41387, partial [Capitella teleta]
RNLEWLKTVRASHGSMEVDALTQAENISRCGIFEVMVKSWNQDGVDLNVDSVMRLYLPTVGEGLPSNKKYYSNQEVRTLQSRLMLVVGQAE